MSEPQLFPEFTEIVVTSTLDGSQEPSLLFLPERPVALLVGLHTWSADRFNQQKAMLALCRERNWALVLPEFRGPNLTKNPRAEQAGGSALARRDIVDAARHVLKEYAGSFTTEEPPVFLLGGSGGGHMSLQVAAREDFPWAGVSSWCPITDLGAWWNESQHSYAPHIEAICGGIPSEKPKEIAERSPLYCVEGLLRYRVQVAHGRYDRAVPYTHTVRLIEKLGQSDLFFYSIFDGAHELRYEEAFQFLDRSYSIYVGAKESNAQLTS